MTTAPETAEQIEIAQANHWKRTAIARTQALSAELATNRQLRERIAGLQRAIDHLQAEQLKLCDDAGAEIVKRDAEIEQLREKYERLTTEFLDQHTKLRDVINNGPTWAHEKIALLEMQNDQRYEMGKEIGAEISRLKAELAKYTDPLPPGEQRLWVDEQGQRFVLLNCATIDAAVAADAQPEAEPTEAEPSTIEAEPTIGLGTAAAIATAGVALATALGVKQKAKAKQVQKQSEVAHG